MQLAAAPRILFIDAYDSFSNNIISLLETRLRVDVTIVKIDTVIKDLPGFLSSFRAVVVGPGPGDPRRPQDVGLFREIWQLRDENLLPILGICLGFQSLVLAFGGSIERLQSPRHGVVRKVRSNNKSIFRGIDYFETVQYHSLFGKLGKGSHDDYKTDDFEHNDFWTTSPDCADLVPLAWDCQADNEGSTDAAQHDENPPYTLMAVKHREKPFYGTQFHAESICSSNAAQNVLVNWWHEALDWRQHHRKGTNLSQEGSALALYREKSFTRSGRNGIGDRSGIQSAEDIRHSYGPRKGLSDRQGQAMRSSLSNVSHRTGSSNPARKQARDSKLEVVCKVSDLGELTVRTICEAMSLTKGEAIVFDSENHQISEVGEFSIIGIVSPSAVRFDYHIGDSQVRQVCRGTTSVIDLQGYHNNVFHFFKAVMRQYQAQSPHTGIPFWGGLMGFISYEACLETLEVPSNCGANQKLPKSSNPNISFVFIERSIVIDHAEKKIHTQSIKSGDHAWVNETASHISTPTMKHTPHSLPSPLNAQISYPSRSDYQSKVRACRSSIAAGDSYELCLTTRATIHTPTSLPPWPLYLRLRTLNPAPFAAYVRLGGLTLLSSSPERFLRWTRPTRTPNPENCNQSAHTTSKCQFRPIKGTLLRQPSPDRPPLALPEATALLSTPKERAENLMIVDLIRHDLHGVVGSGRVTVPKLMAVEEYATLFQLVTVVEGTLIVSRHDSDSSSDSAVEDTNAAPDTTTTTTNTEAARPAPAAPPPAPTHPPGSTQPHTGPPSSPPPPPPPPSTAPSPIDILAHSLPPGSMTGAPKLRSTQLLSALEAQPRGVYSGVVGYFDVGGGGDFSVVIRSAVRWDKVGEGGCREGAEGGDVWTVGAGGAVTWLSTEEGEWIEMLGKLRSTLRIFEDL